MSSLSRLPILTLWALQVAAALWAVARVAGRLSPRRPSPVAIPIRTRRAS